MMNRDLLKEAIADAKAVKETAIANAKAVLEEVFTKNLRAELASKLEEMDNYENMEVEEAMKAKKKEEMMQEFEVNEEKDGIEEEFDLNEILAELEGGGDEEEEMEAGEEEMEAGEEAEMEAGEMGDEEVDLEDMTEDDLKSFIEDVIADMVAAGELEAGEEMEAEMGDMEAEDEMGELAEMDPVSWKNKNNPTDGSTLVDLAPVNENEEVKESLADPGWVDILMGLGGTVGGGTALAYIMKALEDSNNPSLNKIARAIKAPAKALKIDKPVNSKTNMTAEAEDVEEAVTGASGGYEPSGGGGLKVIIDALKSIIKKGGVGAEKAYAELEKLAASSTSKMKSSSGADPTNEGEDEMDQMEELKKELQEVNLLNAKLLYTNKIFNAKNLNESQKLRVLKAFDKASSVKEAKVIFETLNEGMVSKTIKSSMMNEIKSSASKATGFISESKNPIVEVDPMVARWQKLAGIK